MRQTAVFFLYILGAYLLAALLCIPFGDWLSQITGAPVHKIIGRGGLLIALLGFWPFLKLTGLANKQSLGYAVPARQFHRQLMLGYLAGLVILLVLSLMLLGWDIRVPKHHDDYGWIVKPLYQGLLGGLAVGFIEETFFRGAMQSAIKRHAGTLAAIVLPSLLFAALHFLKPQPLPADAPVAVAAVLTSYAGGFGYLFQSSHLDSLAALFMVGVFLALVRNRTESLAWCIGLHAGWVMVIKLTHAYSYRNPEAELFWLAGHYDGMIGWLAAGWLAVLSGLLLLWPLHRQKQKE